MSSRSSSASRSENIRNQKKSPFDLKRVKMHFQDCYDNDFDVFSYVQMYLELNKMFVNFGRVFSIVTSEIDEKTTTMMQYLESNPNMLSYQKVESMLDFEMNNELVWLDRNIPPAHLNSGSRTFLPLHRALNFVLAIIDGLRLSKENDSMATLVSKAYETTLANFHPWIVRQGVYVTVYTLPTRKQVLSDMVGMRLSPKQANQLMLETVTIGRRVYDGCQELYKVRNMLDLP